MIPKHSQHYRKSIKEFVTTFEQKTYKFLNEVPNEVKALRGRLIEEEEQELLQAVTPLDELDAYMDLIYVIEGVGVICGLGVKVEPSKSHSLMHAIDSLLDELYIPVPCDKRMNSYVLDSVGWIEKLCEEAGYDYLKAFNAVHANNMHKLWQRAPVAQTGYTWKATASKGFLVTRPDGKVIKPPNHTKVNLLPFITS